MNLKYQKVGKNKMRNIYVLGLGLVKLHAGKVSYTSHRTMRLREYNVLSNKKTIKKNKKLKYRQKWKRVFRGEK